MGALAANLFGIGADTGDVYLIDTADITSPTIEFSLGSGRDFAGLAYSPVRSTYFAFSRGESQLYEFNRSGVILNVIALDQMIVIGPGPRGIAFDRQGRLFIVGFNNILYEINPDTGESAEQFQASGPTVEIEGLARLDNRALLAVGVSSQVFLLNRDTGDLTNIFDAPVSDLDAMTGTIGGTIYLARSGVGSSGFFAFNPFTQQFDDIGTINISELNGLVEVLN
jgi:outer membrane protein assembly factor BamB